jgi:hypothetical protein
LELLAACGGGGGPNAQIVSPVSASSIAIVASAVDVDQGQSVELTSTVLDGSGHPLENRTVTWSSSDPAKATLSATTGAKVTVRAPLRETRFTDLVTISATVDGRSANVSLTILPPVVLSDLRLVGDDWSTYSSTAAFMANVGAGRLYNDGANQSMASLDTVVKYNGHPTLRYNQPGGTDKTPELWPSLPNGAKLENVWLHAVIRYSPGWTTAGVVANTDNSYKILGLGWSNYYARAGFHLANTTSYQIFTNAVTATSATVMPAVFGMAGRVTSEWQDGGWYDYYLHYEVRSATTTRFRVWRGRAGKTPVLAATVDNAMVQGFSVPLVRSVMLGQNFNQTRAASQSQAIWYGLWEVIDGASHPNPFSLPGF